MYSKQRDRKWSRRRMWNQLGSGKSRGLGWLATDRGSRLCQVLWPGVIRFIQQSAT